MTERTRLQIQAAKMSFLHRLAGLSFRDIEGKPPEGARSSDATPLCQKETVKVVQASD